MTSGKFNDANADEVVTNAGDLGTLRAPLTLSLLALVLWLGYLGKAPWYERQAFLLELGIQGDWHEIISEFFAWMPDVFIFYLPFVLLLAGVTWLHLIIRLPHRIIFGITKLTLYRRERCGSLLRRGAIAGKWIYADIPADAIHVEARISARSLRRRSRLLKIPVTIDAVRDHSIEFHYDPSLLELAKFNSGLVSNEITARVRLRGLNFRSRFIVTVL